MGRHGSIVINYYDANSGPRGLEVPDLYFGASYGAADAAEVEGTWALLEAFDGAWQMPLVVRSIGGGLKDAASPYGYSGVYAAPGMTQADMTTAWTETIKALKSMDVVSVFLRHSPLVHQAPRLRLQRSIVDDHMTVAVDVEDEDAMWARMEGRSRTAVRKAVKAGFTATVRPALLDDLRLCSPFRSLYEGTMRRRQARSSYIFSDSYYVRLHEALGENLLVAECLAATGVVESAALLMRHGRFLHYHLSGSAPDAARFGINNLLLWEALKHAREIGVSRFHLGGGLQGQDSLFKFKKAFGGSTLNYAATGLVVDEAVYAELVGRSRTEHGPSVGAGSPFFPAYRARA